MKMFSEQFLEQDSFEIEYKGRRIYAFYRIEKVGRYVLKFKFVETNANHTQAIIIHLNEFVGRLYINGEEIRKPKGSFPQLIFDETYASQIIELEVELFSGNIVICNGADLLGEGKIWRSLYGGCAMVIEEIEENHFRFLCNDFENDDFDDLIFELEIIDMN